MDGFGDASLINPTMPQSLNTLVVGGAATHSGSGYWLAGADGGVYAFGDAPFEGSLGALRLQGPVVGITNTPDDRGYWMVALDGGVFAFGDAHFYGSMGGQPLAEPIVGMTATPDGGGYWLVAADGGIFTFGDAHFYGSRGGQPLDGPATAMVASPDGGGYFILTAEGGLFGFGDVKYFGSLGNVVLPAEAVGIIMTPDGGGYTIALANGGITVFGDAFFHYYGQPPNNGPAVPFVGILSGYQDDGYWLISPDSWAYNFSNPPPNGTFAGSGAIVAAAASQIQPDPDTGYFCNPYGPCEEWCALFATWAWQQAGWEIPSYAFTGNIYYWAADHGAVLPPSATPVPGDAVLYGTGPQSTSSSVHTAIVAQVWPDGAMVTIDGDSGNGYNGELAVTINGPFLPADSSWYNGFGIYAYAQP